MPTGIDMVVVGCCPHTGVEMEAFEGLHFLASLPLAGTGRTEGGEITQPFNRFHSRLFIWSARLYGQFSLDKTVDLTSRCDCSVKLAFIIYNIVKI